MRRYQKSNYVYTKLRKSFGRQPLFQNVPAHILDSINPDSSLQKEYMLRSPVHREIQATLPQSEHDCNTKHKAFHEQGINHTEGGWPKDVHLYNEEHLARHRRRVQHEDNYVHTVLSLKPHIEHYINQNNAIEMYQSYFTDLTHQAPVEKYKIQIQNAYRDFLNRPISCIVWTHEKKSKIVASYSNKLYPHSNDLEGENCYMWDITKENEPINKFAPEHGCWQVACSPVDPELIITGLDLGITKLFDTRVGSKAISASSIYNSHREPVTALLYSHSRTNTEFFTGSPDGQCLWWDVRNLSQPVDQLPMSIRIPTNEKPHLGNAEGISCLEFDRGLPTKFLAGTESGLILNANRMGRSHSEILHSYWEAHAGPVHAVQRSPCTTRMFISCGDWNVRIWSEETRTAPIIVTKPHRHHLTDVTWAPFRYSSYMVTSEDGFLYYWDLLRKYREPVASLRVSKYGLNKIAPHPKGRSVAVGDNKGSIFLLHLSQNMVESGPNDKQLMQQTYFRETKREHILGMRVREIRLKLQAEVEETTVKPTIDEENDDDLQQETESYFSIVNEELLKMGTLTLGNTELI